MSGTSPVEKRPGNSWLGLSFGLLILVAFIAGRVDAFVHQVEMKSYGGIYRVRVIYVEMKSYGGISTQL